MKLAIETINSTPGVFVTLEIYIFLLFGEKSCVGSQAVFPKGHVDSC